MANGTRGPLPPGVYWRRRAVLLAVVFLLIFGVTRLFGGNADPATNKAAQTSGAQQPAADPTETAELTPSPTPSEKPRGKKWRPESTGVCDPAGVLIDPTVKKAEGGKDVEFVLKLRGQHVPACTFTVSAQTTTIQITSGSDAIWSARECPRQLERQEVTVYQDWDTKARFVWNARRSDSTCSIGTDWAKLGWYHIAAAAFGGEPTSTKFELVRQAPRTVIKTRKPSPTPTLTATPTAAPSVAGKPKPNQKPSGAVEPNQTSNG